MKRIVVVGAGFGGLEATADLDRMFRGHAGVEILPISCKRFARFVEGATFDFAATQCVPLTPRIAA